ncbi:hypothetical protein F4778DRAFT_727665 [Xylariomycetidae sp. FL2044]|nr:hypothetical protein F4778DRAFT_727665 [Xylariomycetidae sp. FL2044]
MASSSFLTTLPVEGILIIAKQLPDMESVLEFSLVCRKVKNSIMESETATCRAVLKTHIGPNLPIAAALHKASNLPYNHVYPVENPARDYRDKIEDFCDQYLSGRQRACLVPNEYFTLRRAVEISAFHRHIQVASQYVGQSLLINYPMTAQLKRSLEAPKKEKVAKRTRKPLSRTETCRLEKAVYIFQLVSRFLPLMYGECRSDDTHMDLDPRWATTFWKHFAPWEFHQSFWVADQLGEVIFPRKLISDVTNKQIHDPISGAAYSISEAVTDDDNFHMRACFYPLHAISQQIQHNEETGREEALIDEVIQKFRVFSSRRRFMAPNPSEIPWICPFVEIWLPRLPAGITTAGVEGRKVFSLSIRDMQASFPGHDLAIMANWLRHCLYECERGTYFGQWLTGTGVFWDAQRWDDPKPFTVEAIERLTRGKVVLRDRTSYGLDYARVIDVDSAG